MTSDIRPVKVWDLPTRLFHWALVALLITSYVTAEMDELEWHMRSGECILALLLFRLGWGVVGSETARFARFVRGPRAVWRYFLPTETESPPGHNPAGGWAVLAMLAILCAQVATGLFADDDISEMGPLGRFVSRAVRKKLTGLHHRIFWLLVAIAALHVGAIAFYRVARKRNLLAPMVTGFARLPAGIRAPVLRPLWLAAVILVCAGAVAAWVASFGDG